jgi:NAD(P)-dependent dehydrogenase (short-subunit alcohol dehydrogenase family)
MLTSLRYLAGTAGPSGFGSRATAEEATAGAGDLRHVTAIITGATSGIGAETARVLAKRGARLVLPARSLKAAEEARARLRAECPGADVVVLPLDLSSLASVRRFVASFLDLGLPLNLLVYVLLPATTTSLVVYYIAHHRTTAAPTPATASTTGRLAALYFNSFVACAMIFRSSIDDRY